MTMEAPPSTPADVQVRRLQALLEMAKAMATQIEMDQLLQVIMERTVEVLDADRCTIFLYDEQRGELWSLLAQGLTTRPICISIDEGLAGYVARTRETVNVPDAYEDDRFNPKVDRETGYRTQSVLCTPVLDGTRLLGVLQVLNKRDGQPFSREDEELMSALCAHVSVALERARTVEMHAEHQRHAEGLKLARQIQLSMLPRNFPTNPPEIGYDLYATMVPAHHVGGDFYDFFAVDEHTVGFALGDVSGKGMPAALVMAVGRSVLKSVAMSGLDPAACLQRVNALLYPECPRNMFITAVYGTLDLRTGDAHYCVAGHYAPYHLRTDGTVAPLPRPRGLGLCLVAATTYQNEHVRLDPGDSLFVFTDGVTEAAQKEGEFYGEQRLEATLARSLPATPRQTIIRVERDLRQFSGGMRQHDDITMLSIEYVQV